MSYYLPLAASIAFVILTTLPVLRIESWWVRALDFPRLQLFITGLLLFFVNWMALEPSDLLSAVLITAVLGCLAYHAWWILPYTRFFPREVKSPTNPDRQRMIRVLTANVLTSNRNAQELIKIVRKTEPDILITLESDSWWQTQLDRLETEYPHAIKCPQDNLYGMHVYSKLLLTERTIEYLVEPEVPSMHALVTLLSGDRIRIHVLHPAPPSPTENEESSERDAELVIVAKSVAETDVPTIVTGDLNDVAWSETTRLFRKLSRLLDPRIGRGLFSTFHADYWFVRWPLDHLFHSRHFTVNQIRRLDKFGSDHFPLFAELVYEAAAGDQKTRLNPDGDDLELARAKEKDEQVGKKDVPEPETH